ncbi:MAG: methyltransferase domain-containing protein [Kiritimatiellales bacterium]|jgi:ubiquinone/menaquinone biosynthesis C-methylase UbiE
MGYEQKLLWQTLTDRCPNIHFQHYYNNRIPYTDSSFNAVAAYGVIEHIPAGEIEQVMSEIMRVTKTDGHLFISYLPRKLALLEILLTFMGRWHHQRRWSDSEITRFLTRFNFQTILRKRIIFAPQFPSQTANRNKPLFDRIDLLADIWPFSLLARDLLVVGKKRSG